MSGYSKRVRDKIGNISECLRKQAGPSILILFLLGYNLPVSQITLNSLVYCYTC